MKVLLLSFLALSPFLLRADIAIEWSSTEDGLDLQSDGLSPLDDDFDFLLGTFVGLTPDRENLSEWEEAFQVFGTASYRPASGRFFASEILSSNSAPFTTTARAYVWGRNGLESGSEWILFGRPAWTWPNATSIGPPPLPERWLVAAVDPEEVVLGTVNAEGVQMQTEAVRLTLGYRAWAAEAFPEAAESEPGQDFEGDGRSNFLEYALGSDPTTEDPPFEVVINSRQELTLAPAPDREVNWVLHESADLKTFAVMTEGFEVIVDEPDRLVFQITGGEPSPRFFRVEARPLK